MEGRNKHITIPSPSLSLRIEIEITHSTCCKTDRRYTTGGREREREGERTSTTKTTSAWPWMDAATWKIDLTSLSGWPMVAFLSHEVQARPGSKVPLFTTDCCLQTRGGNSSNQPQAWACKGPMTADHRQRTSLAERQGL